MKKLCMVLLVLLAAVAFLPAAGQGEDGPVTLQLMYWDNVQKPVIDEAIAEFEAEHPGISVETSIVPWAQYWQKLQTTTVAGTAPDVFWMNVPNFPKYSENGLLMNLQPYLDAEGIDASVYPEDLIRKYSVDGDIHTVPEQYDTIALAYNKRMFDEAGMDYPDETWDWDTLREAAKKLTKDTDNGKQYGFLSTYESQSGYYNFMVMNGGRIISEDWKESGFGDQGSIDAVQFLVDLMYKDECAPSGQQIYELNNPMDMFTSGSVAMGPIGSWYVPVVYGALGEDVDVAPLPKSPATGERRSIIHGLGWAGYAETEHPEATWALLNKLISKGFSQKLAAEGITIPSYAGMETDWVNAIPSMNLNVFIDAQDYSWPYPVSRKTSEWMSIELRELRDAWLGNKSVDEAMAAIYKGMNEVLASE